MKRENHLYIQVKNSKKRKATKLKACFLVDTSNMPPQDGE